MRSSFRYVSILGIIVLFSYLGAKVFVAQSHAYMTLPFCKSEESQNKKFQILRGYLAKDLITPIYQNLGIDYILESSNNQKLFTVIAEDDGSIVAEFPPQRYPTTGNLTIAVGDPNFPTYYIFNDNIIGLGNFKVGDTIHRGEVLGSSTDLHVSVRGNGPIYDDPYVLYSYAPDYPNPDGTNGKRSGPGNYWTTNPPTYSCQ